MALGDCRTTTPLSGAWEATTLTECGAGWHGRMDKARRPLFGPKQRTPAAVHRSCLTCSFEQIVQRPTYRVHSVVPRSQRSGSVKMSSARTQPATASYVQQVSIFIPIRLLLCVS